jgi:hypothetical protein
MIWIERNGGVILLGKPFCEPNLVFNDILTDEECGILFQKRLFVHNDHRLDKSSRFEYLYYSSFLWYK